MSSRVRGSEGAISTGALVAVALVIAAVVGLIAGGVWGQIGDHTATPTTQPTGGASTSTPSPSATTESPSPTRPSPSTSPSSTTGPTPTGAAPSAPATTTTVVDGWRLGSWKITSAGGTLGVDTTARNTGTATSSANLVLYVYIGGQLIATTTATVTDVPAGSSVPVHFAGTDPWKPGQKVLLLALA